MLHRLVSVSLPSPLISLLTLMLYFAKMPLSATGHAQTVIMPLSNAKKSKQYRKKKKQQHITAFYNKVIQYQN
ncbi:hypothetical protein F5X96DRAFT_644610 [Biscogniauxia mediterranea]|nr:hypothetical protein F5X96DRAFT_644610 [Biscogniauxia mediterranea]